MLARSLLGRLTAEVPRTHDLSRLPKLIHHAVLSHNAAMLRAIVASANLSRASLTASARHYATTTAKPKAAKSTRASATSSSKKSTTAKKAAPKKKTVAKKATATKKAAPKKKTAAKKKPATRQRKPLTDRQRELKAAKELRAKILEYRETALSSPKQRPSTAWMVLMTEQKSQGTSAVDTAKSAAAKYSQLTPAERERYNHLAAENKAANEAEYKKWVESLSPIQIKEANNARKQLRQLLTKETKVRVSSTDLTPIRDERQVVRKRSALIFYVKDRVHSDDYKGLSSNEKMKLMASEFVNLGASEKKKFEDMAKSDEERYIREHTSVYGLPPPLVGKRAQSKATAA